METSEVSRTQGWLCQPAMAFSMWDLIARITLLSSVSFTLSILSFLDIYFSDSSVPVLGQRLDVVNKEGIVSALLTLKSSQVI